ncbi:hypothetical protein MUCCIDRAFT_84089 [Mucor lusitanicus CBS 277.49]|uniref:V-SNARE coiled-coil homology domain-containing protein n=2 Tax=Mucor circinelloides f. lusitanicus TaxID=29924 RepID=A0A162Q5E5_MUCCL|nr:hypothetical protein MUCCIDRAFT_84089 [Mucor lusitanicus CBS 277.49]
MSLLDKISGLAQKAKENVVSKTFISKDKRLEHSLSEHIKVNDIYFEKISTYGLPSTINAIAYDCIAGLLAVVFGKGISTTISLPKSTGIKHLQFKTGFPILVVIDKANTIITIDLRTKSVRHVLPAPEIITSQTYCTGTDWLFIGYANGFIDVFDIMQGTMTPYQIPDLLENQEVIDPAEIAHQHIVVDLQMHPTELNTLLIGYEAIVFVWNIRESTIRRSYSLRKLDKSSIYRNANLTCFAWSPNGSRFIAGYDDGCTHLWDVKNEQKPITSRRISEAFAAMPGGEEGAAVSEPIYQMAWYANTAAHKSYVVVAGGSNALDIQGLNVLEFDLDSDSREAKKQSIMPLPTDLSHFLILSTDPYYLGMHNPLGIAVVGADHCLRVLSLEHGFPLFKLPPALEFLGPNILNACHIPQLPSAAFKRLAGMTTSDRQTRYLPITGGVAGPEHVYHIDTNDLLVTIHQGEVLKFWDASYTALRPLSYLTIHCLDDLADQDAFLCCLDVNKINGTLTVGFSDGSILIYEYQPDAQIPTDVDPRLRKRNEEFINSCDDTLKEISDLLEDMGSVSDTQDEEAAQTVTANTNPFLSEQAASTAATNPFLSPSPTHQQQPQPQQPDIPSEASTPPLPPRNASKPPSIFHSINKHGDHAGFYPLVRISLGKLPVKSVVSVGDTIIAAASEDGTVHVLDIHRQLVLFSCNIALVVPAVQPKSDVAAELEEADPSKTEQKKPASITSIHFFNTYSPSKVMAISTQLYAGLSNGHIYQFNLATLDKVTPETLNEHLSMRVIPGGPVLDMHMIDLQGASQVALSQHSEEEQQKLSKQPSHHSSNASDEETSPKPSSIVSNSSSVATSTTTGSSKDMPSKRMAAIGKGEYRQQEHPHLHVCISTHSVHIFLSGFNVKLFAREFNATSAAKIIRGQVVHSHQGVCLVLLTDNGKLAFYSLPALELMLEMSLPNHCLLDRLQEASLSEDGRVVFWSGRYEMEQFSFIPKPDMHFGESVILFDSSRAIPSHPSLITQQQQQKTKKTWLDTVAGAFQKEPLTLQDLDLLMGRVPMEDPNELRRQKIDAYKAKMEKEASGSNSSSKGPGGVFSQLGDKVNERGEKLNQLDQKFQDMNAASGDFLKAVKEYNERQARKKWWEF